MLLWFPVHRVPSLGVLSVLVLTARNRNPSSIAFIRRAKRSDFDNAMSEVVPHGPYLWFENTARRNSSA